MAAISGTGSVELPQGHVLEGLTIYGACAQDGTPSPDNPVEIKRITSLALYTSDGQKVEIDLQGYELCSLGGGAYRDMLTIGADGHCVIEKACAGATISDFGWMKYSSNNTRSVWQTVSRPTVDMVNTIMTAPFLSTRFNAVSNGKTWTPGEISWTLNWRGGIIVICDVNLVSASEDLLSLYGGTEIIYPLAEPTTIDLGYIELPDVRDASTLSVIADVEPEIEVATSEYSIAGGGASMNGRNLLRFTGHPTYAGVNSYANLENGWCTWLNTTGYTVERTDESIKFTAVTGSGGRGFVIPLAADGILHGGSDEVLTLSFQYRGSIGTSQRLYLMAKTGGNAYRFAKALTASETEWQTFTETFYFPSIGTRESYAILFPYTDVAGDWFEVRDSTMKLEYGTTATPWRPAPEDTEQPSDVVYASEGVDLGDTSGDKLIANINLAGDTAKISASHVEINGQATFTAIKQYSDAAYDASGAATGAVNALKTDLASSTGTTVINGGHIETGSLTIGQVDSLQSTLNGKADDADVTAAISTAAADATSKANAAQAAAESTAAADATSKANDAKKYATNYIALDPVNGIRIADANPDTATTYQKQTSTSTEFFVDGESRLKISGDGQRIGKEYVLGATDNESHMELDYHSLQMVDKNGNTYLHVSDLRNADGYITDVFDGDGVTTQFELVANAKDPSIFTSVFVDNTEITTGVTKNVSNVTFATAPNNGSTVKVVYIPLGESAVWAKAFTYGIKAPGNNKIGLLSFRAGFMNVASGVDSVAMGGYATASGSNSFAVNSTASGAYSVAMGNNTTASGNFSTTLGNNTTASGDYSTATGNWTIASGDNQVVIGTHNIEDTNDEYAIIVGNGTSDTARSNAQAVRWNGLTDVAGRTAYPLFVYSTAPDEADLPVTPCFVLATSDYGLWYYDGN